MLVCQLEMLTQLYDPAQLSVKSAQFLWKI